MPEKIQHTSLRLQEKMSNRYNDDLHHKHNKDHLLFRRHGLSHPSQPLAKEEVEIKGSTGLKRQLNLRKFRRQAYGRVH